MSMKSHAFLALAAAVVAGGLFLQSAIAGGAPASGPAAPGAAAPGAGAGGPGFGGGAPGGGALGGGGGRNGRGAGRGFAATPPGPPAPVPPEVAQPNADQVKAMNDELKKFISSNTSPTKSLLEKYESTLLLPAPRLNVAATYTQTNQRRGNRH